MRDANALRRRHPALRSNARPQFTHFDPDNGVLAFKRWNNEGDVVLTVVNLGERQFDQATLRRQPRRRRRHLGGSLQLPVPPVRRLGRLGNYLAFPSVQSDGRIYIRLPKLAVLVFRKT